MLAGARDGTAGASRRSGILEPVNETLISAAARLGLVGVAVLAFEGAAVEEPAARERRAGDALLQIGEREHESGRGPVAPGGPSIPELGPTQLPMLSITSLPWTDTE